MKNQNGITLVYLITIIIIMIIIASITVGVSLSSFKQMKYETVKAELEEIQTVVNEICEDYELAGIDDDSDGDEDYSTYFEEKYGSIPDTVEDSIEEDGVSDIVSIYASLSTTEKNIFYFDTDDIKTYLGLETTIGSVLIDFETRYIYSVDGVSDPTTDEIYYTLSEMNGGTNIYEDTEEASSSLTGVTATDDNSGMLQAVGDTNLLEITLTAKRGTTGTYYPIKKAYYSTDGGETYIEVDYLGDCTYTEDTVSFVIYEEGTYIFKIVDTYGAEATVTKVIYNYN